MINALAALSREDAPDDDDFSAPTDDTRPDDNSLSEDDNNLSPEEDDDTPPVDENGSPVLRTPEQVDHVTKLKRWIVSKNIAEEPDFPADRLGAIGMAACRLYEVDDNTRSDWKTKNKEALKLALQITEQKQYPWPKASNVIFPMITTAAMQFAARAYPAIVAGRNVVKGVVVGNDDGTPATVQGQPVPDPQNPGQPLWVQKPGAKRDRADRIGQHMSWQLLDEQPEWEDETDRLLHVLPIVGCGFRKTFFDPEEGRNSSLYVSAEKIVINYKAKSLDTAPRITEEVDLYPQEIQEKILAGLFIDQDYPNENGEDEDAPVGFLEQHAWLDLDDDGYKEPYIITLHKQSQKVASIVARYDEDGIRYNFTKRRIQKIRPVHYYTKYDFLPNVEGGIYGMGFGELLSPINAAVNTTLNMLIDAGHLANVSGGFIGKGLNMNAGSLRFQPGEFKHVNTPGPDIRSAIVQLQFPGPSTVLFQLLGMLVEAGKDIAAVKDVLTGEQQQANTPATTTLALIEQGLKVFSAIYKRIHRGLKNEFGKLYRLNRLYLNQEASFRFGDDWKTVTLEDYSKAGGVEPYSDPTMVSDMQRLGRAQFLMQFANDPVMNGIEIRRRMLDAANIENVDALLYPQPGPPPALLAKMAELETKRHEVEAGARLKDAQALLAKASAINQFAQADKAVGDQHVAWIETQLAAIQQDFEQAQAVAAAGQGGDQNSSPTGSPGAPKSIVPPDGPIAPSALPGGGASPLGPGGPPPSDQLPGVQEGAHGLYMPAVHDTHGAH